MSLDTRPRADLVADALGRVDALRVFGFVFFVVATLAIWTQFRPFVSLQDYASLADPTASNELRKFGTLAISALLVAYLIGSGQQRQIFRVATIPVFVAVVAWFGLVSLLSDSPSLALNRLVLAVIIVQIAYATPTLFARPSGLIDALSIATGLIMAASLVAILLFPENAIHSSRDLAEQALAGDWRGVFAHKNDLSAMASIFVFVGILVARTRNWALGAALTGAALLLLVMSGGKTSTLLLVPVLAGALALVRLRSRALSYGLVLGLLLGMGFFTVGGTLFPALKPVMAMLPDPSFTGRADVWAIAVQAIGRSLWLGHGYAIFWDTGMAYSVALATSSAATFSHAHNGFLEVTLSGGLLGLGLVLVWTIYLPFRQIETIKRQLRNRGEMAFLDFLAQVWLFGLLNTSLEAVLFNRGNPVWYTILVAMACLQQWAMSRKAPL